MFKLDKLARQTVPIGLFFAHTLLIFPAIIIAEYGRRVKRERAPSRVPMEKKGAKNRRKKNLK